MKAVAVPYIIAIILAIIVLAIVAYWFLTTAQKGGGTFDEAFCRGKLTQYCAIWSGCNYANTCKPGDFYNEFAKGCESYQPTLGVPSDALCKSILGVG
jgi:hypothetical protein